MQTYDGKTLEGWIQHGRQTGRIQRVLTVTKAYCMDRPSALRWLAGIASGVIAEDDALAAFESTDRREASILMQGDLCEQLASETREIPPPAQST